MNSLPRRAQSIDDDDGPARFNDVTAAEYADNRASYRPMMAVQFIEYLSEAAEYLFADYPEVSRVVARPGAGCTIVLVGLTDDRDAVINGHLFIGADADL